MKKLIALSAACVAFASPVCAADGAMTGQELTKLLSNGKVIVLGGPGKGYSGSLTLGSNGVGKGSATTDDGRVIELSGTWAIEGDEFCRTWTGAGSSGERVCETWVRTGRKSVDVVVDGEVIGSNSW
jgi:hypothetical protein